MVIVNVNVNVSSHRFDGALDIAQRAERGMTIKAA